MNRWTEDDETYIEYYVYDEETKGYDDASDFLGRSRKDIANKVSRLRKDNNVTYIKKPWTPKEDELIRNYYTILPAEAIAERLRRTVNSVWARASRLGVKKEKNLSDYDEQIRKLAAEGCYNNEISEKLGLDPTSLIRYRARHGIRCEPAPKEVAQRHFRNEEKLRWIKIKENRDRINGKEA